MENVRVGLQPPAIGCLQLPNFLRFRFTGIGGEAIVDEKIPDFLAPLPGVERFILGVADPAKILIRNGRLRSVAAAHQLHNSFALIDLVPEEFAQISPFRPEDILPGRLVAKKAERISH